MFKANFSGQKNCGGAQKYWRTLPPNAPPCLRAWVERKKYVSSRIRDSLWRRSSTVDW